ncbi:DUF397 domain-containing protein [Fodinicola feengrottensis]|uniref:DUF397 domain-containing protein n=1 Tax=Fodinicola feengrottensis TaxID=435914 RepID=UPI0024422A12|nr:DUF397 domain-containing protein [Fodinicola feengrottensis]
MEPNVWITSSRSGNNGQCVEVRNASTHVDVRDSKIERVACSPSRPTPGRPSPVASVTALCRPTTSQPHDATKRPGRT